MQRYNADSLHSRKEKKRNRYRKQKTKKRIENEKIKNEISRSTAFSFARSFIDSVTLCLLLHENNSSVIVPAIHSSYNAFLATYTHVYIVRYIIPFNDKCLIQAFYKRYIKQ